jgi:vacuolar protein-sorting-associated protein 4
MRRRFEKRVYIALPEAHARAKMFKLNLGDTPHSVTDEQFDLMGEMTEGYSGSDVAVIVREALMEPLRKCQNAKQFMIDGDGFYNPCEEYPNCAVCPMQLSSPYHSAALGRNEGDAAEGQRCPNCGCVRMSLYSVPSEKLKVPVITFADFEKVLSKARSSVGADELDRFVAWTSEYGQEG